MTEAHAQFFAEFDALCGACQPVAAVPPVTFQAVKSKARYGHKNWLFWTDRNGVDHAARVTPASVKAAMLATGTKGRFFELAASTGISNVMNWPLAVIRRRNCRYTEGRI